MIEQLLHQLLEPQVLGILAIAVFLALLIRWPRSLIFSNPKDPSVTEIPGLPLLGNTLQIMKHRDEVLGIMHEWQQTHGKGGQPYTASFPPLGRVYMCNRPIYLEHIQKKAFASYPKGPNFRGLFSDVLGEHGIFVADGQIWKEERKTASTVFSASSFKTHITKALRKELGVLKQLYTTLANSGEAVNLQDIHFRFTLATFGVFAFDDGFGALPSDPEKLHHPVPFGQAFDYAQHIVDRRLSNPFWKVTELVSSEGRKMREATKTIHSHAYRLVDHHRAERKEKDDLEKGEHANLLQLFCKLTDDRQVLMETCLNFIIAGRDTTAQALSWWFWYIITRPDVTEKIRAEAEKVIGKDGAVDYDNLKELTYITACFYETLRLHPSVPKNMKMCVEDNIMPGDPEHNIPSFHVRKGDTVIFSTWAMGRMTEVWGPDALEYKPERWLDDQGKLTKESQFKFNSFNAGPRLCLGQTLATFEACSVVAEVLRDFDVVFADPASGNEAPIYGNSLTLPLRNPYDVRFKKRSAA